MENDMASEAPAQQLPLLYNSLEPLSSNAHGTYKARATDRAPYLTQTHAVPITIDEFVTAQRYYPIVFSSGDMPVPLALMGLNENVNVFFDEEGKLLEDVYVPAYIRRFPFLLARLENNSETMSLCFDPSTELVGEFEDGDPLFEADKPTERTQEVLKFCESFEEAGMRTQQFMEELKKADLLMEGEVAIQQADKPEQPYVYRGFQMINEQKLREVRGDQLRKWNDNGMLALVFAHLFSVDLMRIIFAKQAQQGKGPAAAQPALSA
jgi:hypothetical protein